MNIFVKFLEFASVYRLFQFFAGKRSTYKRLIDEWIRPKPQMHIIDFGCGPAKILGELEGVTYLGIDINSKYIEKASGLHGNKGSFLVGGEEQLGVQKSESKDLFLLLGVLHHLPDEQVDGLLFQAQRILKKDGRLVTVDGVYYLGQGRLNRLVTSLDRGRFVRYEESYRNLLEKHFSINKSEIWSSSHKIPYSVFVTECKKLI